MKGSIYKITNLVNQKLYIGATTLLDPYTRWKEHQRAARKDSCKNRPLYMALNKYGVDNFSFEIIEYTEDIVEREIYWIDFYNTYHEGYNATLGGEGKTCFINIEEITKMHLSGLSCNQIGLQTHHDGKYIAKVLEKNNVPVHKGYGKQVLQYSIDGIYLQTFPSRMEAARWLAKYTSLTYTIESMSVRISMACRYIEVSEQIAYGYIWKTNYTPTK